MDREAWAYARDYLAAHEKDYTREEQPFRTHSGHMQRVCMWVERLLPASAVDQPQAVRLAAAMHDVGYAHAHEGHGLYSATILSDYASARGIQPDTAHRAAWLVQEHSNKRAWMTNPQAPADLILLMEADLLDEEGAMGLALDCMTAAALKQDYAGAYARMQRYEPARLAENPMVTPQAHAYWSKKQRIIREFLDAFAFDLGVDDET